MTTLPADAAAVDGAHAEAGFRASVGADFPCPFAGPAASLGLVRFVDHDWRRRSASALHADVADYLGGVRVESDPRRQERMVLVVEVLDPWPDVVEHAFEVLRDLVAIDAALGSEVPADMPDDPFHPQWALVLDGEPVFVNLSSDRLHNRRSRNLGAPLTLVIQPRAGIDRVAPPDLGGEALRQRIRRAVDRYDRIPRSPALGRFGDPTSRDVLQMWLGDTNEGAVHPRPVGRPQRGLAWLWSHLAPDDRRRVDEAGIVAQVDAACAATVIGPIALALDPDGDDLVAAIAGGTVDEKERVRSAADEAARLLGDSRSRAARTGAFGGRNSTNEDGRRWMVVADEEPS